MAVIIYLSFFKIQTLEMISNSYTDTIKGLAEEDRKSLKNTGKKLRY